MERKLSKEAEGIFNIELEEWIMRRFSDDDKEVELKRENEEAEDIFYIELEEWIMRLISDDDEEVELKRENEVPSLSINRVKRQLFPMCDSFIDVRCYGSFDMGMRKWQALFGCENWNKSIWATYEMNKLRRSVLARGRKGTGVFIPRYELLCSK